MDQHGLRILQFIHCTSVPAVAAWWLDLGQRGEVEIGDRLERLGHGSAAQAVRQRLQPIDTLGLDPQQRVGCVIPALNAAASIDWSAGSDHDVRRWLQVARAIASLALGVALRMLALWFLTSRHGPRSPLRNALQWGRAASGPAYWCRCGRCG